MSSVFSKKYNEEEYSISEFENVTVIREANIYFDGNVTSRSVVFSDGAGRIRVQHRCQGDHGDLKR